MKMPAATLMYLMLFLTKTSSLKNVNCNQVKRSQHVHGNVLTPQPIAATNSVNYERRRAMEKIGKNLLLASGAIVSSCGELSSSGRKAWARNMPISTGADTSNYGTPKALVPIVELRQSLETIRSTIVSGDDAIKTFVAQFPPSYYANSLSTLQKQQRQKSLDTLLLSSKSSQSALILPPTDESGFKKIFDAYSDPVSYKQKFVDQNAFLVYYSKGFDGAGRPSIESDLPVKQTMQYGTRNEAWVAWDEFLSEIDYYKKLISSSTTTKIEKNDLLEPLSKTIEAVDTYLNLVPKDDLNIAQAS